MKTFIPILALSIFTLAGCQTMDDTTKSDEKNMKTEKVDNTECTPTPENPQCETGGGPISGGPVTVTGADGDCDGSDPDNPQCGTGGPISGGPVTDD